MVEAGGFVLDLEYREQLSSWFQLNEYLHRDGLHLSTNAPTGAIATAGPKRHFPSNAGKLQLWWSVIGDACPLDQAAR
jgi:hypothetical protein